MDTPIGLCYRNALHAVSAAFIFHAAISAPAFDDKRDVFDAALPSFIDIQYFNFPAPVIGIAAVHAEKFAREKRGLVTTRSSLDSHDGVFLIHDIFGQQGNSNLIEQLLFVRFEAFHLFKGQITHLWLIALVVHFLGLGDLLIIRLQLGIFLRNL